ncbi:MAG: hypothetical protein QXI12_06650 [Candidatus Methanomethyliaceae archaeon]
MAARILAFVGIGLVLVALSESKTLGPLVLAFVILIFIVALVNSPQTLGLLEEAKSL